AQKPRRRHSCRCTAAEGGQIVRRRSHPDRRRLGRTRGPYREHVVRAQAMNLRISIVGMGDTGTLAARRLLEAEPDIALTVYDLDPERCEPFRGSATLATSAREALAESDTVVLALPREREIDRT